MTMIRIPGDRRVGGTFPIAINGKVQTLTYDQDFDASDSLIALLNNDAIRYVLVTTPGAATGRITLSRSLGPRVPVGVNGRVTYLDTGVEFTPAAGVLEIIQAARLPYTVELGTVAAAAQRIQPVDANSFWVMSANDRGTAFAHKWIRNTGGSTGNDAGSPWQPFRLSSVFEFPSIASDPTLDTPIWPYINDAGAQNYAFSTTAGVYFGSYHGGETLTGSQIVRMDGVDIDITVPRTGTGFYVQHSSVCTNGTASVALTNFRSAVNPATGKIDYSCDTITSAATLLEALVGHIIFTGDNADSCALKLEGGSVEYALPNQRPTSGTSNINLLAPTQTLRLRNSVAGRTIRNSSNFTAAGGLRRGRLSRTANRSKAYFDLSPASGAFGTRSNLAWTTSFETSGGALVKRAISGNGQAPIAAATVSGGKSRMQFRERYPIMEASDACAPRWTNKRLTTTTAGMADGDDYTIRFATLEVNGVSYPLTFDGGSPTKLVTAGTLKVEMDPYPLHVEPWDDAWVHGEIDLGTNYVTGVRHQIALLEANGVDQCYVYDPANQASASASTSVGPIATPTGGTAANPLCPVDIVGFSRAPKTGIFGAGTSIEAGTGDYLAGYGMEGGGWMQRGAALMARPYTSFAIASGLAEGLVAALPFINAFLPEYEWFTLGAPTNDIALGKTAAQALAFTQTLAAAGATAGAKVAVGKIIARLSASTNLACTLAGQTVATGFGVGEAADTYNGLVTAGGNITAIIDTLTPTTDAATRKWKPRAFTATLSASVSSGASSATMSAKPRYLAPLVFEPGTSNDNGSGFSQVSATSGTAAPFTVAIGFTVLAAAHASGTAVAETPCQDLIHPANGVHQDMAAMLPLALGIYPETVINGRMSNDLSFGWGDSDTGDGDSGTTTLASGKASQTRQAGTANKLVQTAKNLTVGELYLFTADASTTNGRLALGTNTNGSTITPAPAFDLDPVVVQSGDVAARNGAVVIVPQATLQPVIMQNAGTAGQVETWDNVSLRRLAQAAA